MSNYQREKSQVNQSSRSICTGSWFKSPQFPSIPDFSPEKLLDFARSALFFQSLNNQQTCFDESFKTVNERVEEITRKLLNLGYRKVYQASFDSKKCYFFSHDSAVVGLLTVHARSLMDCQIVCNDEKLYQETRKLFDS